MLVEESPPAELVGYLSAVADQPGFVVPLFRRRSSNMLLVQEVGVDGRVRNFRTVEPREVRSIGDDEHQLLRLGDAALWGFRDKSGTASFADRGTLQQHLSGLLDEIDQPFLKLQVAQFCEDDAELVGAWREAFQHLAERSPRSANAWRDVVVIPAQMRLAVENAILMHGLDASVEQLGRTVEVDVRDDRLRLCLDSNLHAAFMASPAAQMTLERRAASVRKAFDLASGRLSLVSREPPSLTPAPEASEWDGIAVAAIGKMATSLLRQIMPRAEGPTLHHQSSGLEPRRAETRIVLFQRDKPIVDDTLDHFPQLAPVNGARNVFVIFQLAKDLRYLLDEAVSFAGENRAQNRQMIAVIPHLPEGVGSDAELAESIVPTLNSCFDAVWALSDRSPYARQSLPYGPARSAPAAASHLRYLLGLGRSNSFRRSMHREDRPSTGLSVIGSAVGDVSAARLTDHAMMRLTHHLFDLSSASLVQVLSAGRVTGFEDAIRETINREAPQAKVEISSAGLPRAGPTSIALTLSGVRLLPSGAQAFERFCIAQLDRHGWTIARVDQAEITMSVSRRELHGIAIECRFVAEGKPNTALREPQRRHRIEDSIVLTNMMIRRRTFARNVLSGQVPVHCSRIEAMYHIYRRRYSYVLTYLNQEKRGSIKLLVPFALDVIDLQCAVSQRFGRAKLQSDDAVHIDRQAKRVLLSIPLLFTGGRAANAVTIPGDALVTLDEGGWHVEALNVDGREIVRSRKHVSDGSAEPQSEV